MEAGHDQALTDKGQLELIEHNFKLMEARNPGARWFIFVGDKLSARWGPYDAHTIAPVLLKAQRDRFPLRIVMDCAGQEFNWSFAEELVLEQRLAPMPKVVRPSLCSACEKPLPIGCGGHQTDLIGCMWQPRRVNGAGS